jgi:hypothetical protein
MMGLLKRIASPFNSVVESYDDPDLGLLRREGGRYWTGEVPFEHKPSRSRSMSLLIDSGEGHPTAEQRALFHEILGRYGELWPGVAEALAGYHSQLKTAEAVEKYIDEPCLCLYPLVGSGPRRWSVDYTFNYPTEGDMGYGVEFSEWEIVEVWAGD